MRPFHMPFATASSRPSTDLAGWRTLRHSLMPSETPIAFPPNIRPSSLKRCAESAISAHYRRWTLT